MNIWTRFCARIPAVNVAMVRAEGIRETTSTRKQDQGSLTTGRYQTISVIIIKCAFLLRCPKAVRSEEILLAGHGSQADRQTTGGKISLPHATRPL